MLAENAPPFCFIRDGKPAGLGVEVVKSIARRTNTPVTIKVYPWARAYRMAQEDSTVGIFMTARDAQRERQFQWVGPIHISITAFYGKRGTPIQLDSLADARAISRILVPREWYSDQLLRGRGFTNLYTVDTAQQMVRLVLVERAEVMVVSDVVLSAVAKEIGATASDFQMLYPLNQVHGYIAFSLTTPRETVQRWQRALDDMKRDGRFAKIYRKWMPGEVPRGLLEVADGAAK